jgi:Mg-chelatase subunit ChlD
MHTKVSSTWSSSNSTLEPANPSVAISLSADPESHILLINLTPPHQPEKRAPFDICCVIDVSGSMGSDAPIPGDLAKGIQAESTGLSVLDLVKHSLRTIIATMKEDDRIALVTFSDSAQVVSQLTNMTTSGKKTVLDAIERLKPHGSTNLWDGLKVGMNILNEDFAKARNTDIASSHHLSTIFILTDGMPNVPPPRGHIPMLKSYLDAHPMSRQFSISTFGFGYSLDTQLLLEIALVGGGGYGFIPDPSMVGTVFIHAAANAYSTYAPRAKLDVEVSDGVDVQAKGGLPIIKTSWGVQIDAGDIQFGQSRNFVLGFNKRPANIAVTASYRPFTSAQDLNSATVVLSNVALPDRAAIEYHTARLKLVEILIGAKHTDLSTSIEALESLQKNITASPILTNHPDAHAVAQDVSGEGLLGLQPAHFGRWGRHYFPSLALAHLRQQCGNFKDPGLQVYGRESPIFIEERDKLDAAFDALPPPKPCAPPPSFSRPQRFYPSTQKFPSNGSSFHSNTQSGVNVMSASYSPMPGYNSPVGPCFNGHCLVKLFGGMQVRVEELKRGMEVMTLKGPRKVAAVLRTSTSSGEELLCRIGDVLEITPWHPVRAQNQGVWVFPIDIVVPQPRPCEAVYSILLVPDSESDDPEAHSASIGGMWCVTLGHGLTSSADGDIRAHTFLGSYDKVLKEISHLDGFYDADGVVKSSGTKRSVVDGKICGFFRENEGLESGGVTCELRNTVHL